MAEQLSKGDNLSASSPYVYRVGIPFIVGKFFGDNIIQGFKVINVLSNSILILLLTHFFQKNLNNIFIRITLVSFYMLMWHGPIRFVYWYPTIVDNWLITLFLASWIVANKYQKNENGMHLLYMIIIGILATFVREVGIIIGLSFLFIKNPIKKNINEKRVYYNFDTFIGLISRIKPILFLPLVLSLGIFILIKSSVIATNSENYHFYSAAFYWAHKNGPMAYILAWYNSIGILFPLLIYNLTHSVKWLKNNQFLATFFAIGIILSWIGGGDTERFIYWIIPIALLLVGKSILKDFHIYRKSKLLLGLIAII